MNTPNNKRRRDSRRKIETAFIKLIQTVELEQIRVTEICKAAEVNRTTFYANYEDIYALADAVEARLEEEVLALYGEEREQGNSTHNFLKLFYHIRDNQLFYKTYFKLRPNGKLKSFGYDAHEAAVYFRNQNIEYHIEFFGNGLNAVIRMWLDRDCRETPEEIFAIIQDEYNRRLEG